MTPGSGSNADAIMAVGNGAGNLVFTCGGSRDLPSITPGPGADAGVFGNPVPTTPGVFPAAPPTGTPPPTSTPLSLDATSTIIALQQDQGEALLEATPEGTAEETAREKAPICR